MPAEKNDVDWLLEKYTKQSEPRKYDKGYAWGTAIGLQSVDGIKPSNYLVETAIRNIEGEIDLADVEKILNTYYKENRNHSPASRTEEADKVSLRIAQILSEKTFTFTVESYVGIHRRLFSGIYSHAGKIRDYNISKKEWVLDGKSVLYGNAFELNAALNYDISVERDFRYKGLSQEEIIRHISVFISRLWQIHAFGEGNTRTTAVFLIKYLRYLGYDADNDSFAKNAWYFRNALVRANYNDLKNGIHETTEYLELFMRNLLLGENNELHSRNMHISGLLNKEAENGVNDCGDANTECKKQDIDDKKQDIHDKNQDIGRSFSKPTQEHISRLKESFANGAVFGRTDIMKLLQLSASPTSELIKKLKTEGIIEPVHGYGKGKYRLR